MSDPALDIRALQRQLLAILPEARPTRAGEKMLELATLGSDAPRLMSATIVEGIALAARSVPSPPVPRFQAFLDGIQRSELVAYVGGAPIVLGHAAAVVRERHQQRLRTWAAPLRERRLYAPRTVLHADAWNALASALGDTLVDTTATPLDAGLHPFALRDAAVHQVQSHRESLERRLAEQWCATEPGVLFIDGGISASETVARAPGVVGVVKSHRTLYADGDGVGVVLGLALGQRSSVFRVTSPRRTTVASWYLRMRDPAGRDPMFGLVRVEVAYPAADALPGIAERADSVSRWILAESTPLSLPDARWDRMVYGIRDCEEFLRATDGR